MDKTTLPGLILALVALLGGAFMEGTTPDKLVMLPAFIIVFGGTFGAAMISFPLEVTLALPKYFGILMKDAVHDLTHVVETFVKLADRARREGLLALEGELADLDDPFLRRALEMAVDGTDPDQVAEILGAEIDTKRAHDHAAAKLFHDMGGYGPTIGIIGTVLGLVHVLSNLGEPNSLGAKIASAFVATLWGVMSANIFWFPLSNRLKRIADSECEEMELALEGVMAIQAGSNPRLIAQKLQSMLPPQLPASDDEREVA